MISYIIGKLIEVNDNRIVVETAGIGFDIFFLPSVNTTLPDEGNTVKIYTYMNVKEDEMSLYGFIDKEERDIFTKLLTVSGVGPKSAQNVISSLGVEKLVNAISREDVKILSSVKGLGAKTAKNICTELSDKIKKMNTKQSNAESDVYEEVIEALKKLGYKEYKARELLSKIEIDDSDTSSELLKKVLKK